MLYCFSLLNFVLYHINLVCFYLLILLLLPFKPSSFFIFRHFFLIQCFGHVFVQFVIVYTSLHAWIHIRQKIRKGEKKYGNLILYNFMGYYMQRKKIAFQIKIFSFFLHFFPLSLSFVHFLS